MANAHRLDSGSGSRNSESRHESSRNDPTTAMLTEERPSPASPSSKRPFVSRRRRCCRRATRAVPGVSFFFVCFLISLSIVVVVASSSSTTTTTMRHDASVDDDVNDAIRTKSTRKLYEPKRPVAPPRPADAPPIDYGGKHPFEQQSSSTKSLLRRNLEQGDERYKPIRIHLEDSSLQSRLNAALASSNGDVTATKLFLLLYHILPNMVEVWNDVVRVIPVEGGIYPLGGSGDSSDDPEEGSRAYYCPEDKTSGISGGADLLIYVTVDRHCGDGEGEGNVGGTTTLASAISCERDQFDRPITGTIDFCLAGMGSVNVVNVAEEIATLQSQQLGQGVGGESGTTTTTSQSLLPEEANSTNSTSSGNNNDGEDLSGGNDGGSTPVDDNPNAGTIKQMTEVAVHEFGHVLGVTSDSLPYFRHPLSGIPLTQRPFVLSTITCVDGNEMVFLGAPSSAVMSRGTTPSGAAYYEVVTPTVRQVVRNHFNCPTLQGARLENQPTSNDCFGSHWDERLFYTETMGSIFSHVLNVLSPLTLALLEDSGWYRTNYTSPHVQLSPFGIGAGCPFVEQDCINADGSLPSAMEGHFCNDVATVGDNGRISEHAKPQTCDPTRTHKASCDLVDSNQVPGLDFPPEEFQYFDGHPSYRPYFFHRADFCPIPSLATTDCRSTRNKPSSTESAQAGEAFGPNSRCYDTTDARDYSLCLNSVCNAEIGKLKVVVLDGLTLTCDYDGQVHTISNGGGEEAGERPLQIVCPRLVQVCPELTCPANCRGRGRCVFRTENSLPTNSSVSEPVARCVCNSAADTTPGCFETPLTFPEGYGEDVYNPNRADKTKFMLATGMLVTGLAVLYCVVRQYKAKRNVFM